MLPTPSTSHVSFDTIYEPAEDSFLLLDTLSSSTETQWLHRRFQFTTSPVVLEVGTGSGVVLAFLTANARAIFGREDVLTLGTDVNGNACRATEETAHRAVRDTLKGGRSNEVAAMHIGCLTADLCSPLRSGAVDVLVFNPPYVPTPELPQLPSSDELSSSKGTAYEQDSALLSFSYAGGKDGMETTNRLLEDLPRVLDRRRGVAYVLLCEQNKIEDVEALVRGWGESWGSAVVGSSGKKAGWERLKILRIWRKVEDDM